jgi:hypothetical protein
LSAVVTGARGFDPDYVDITWKAEKGRVAQTGVAADGTVYEITSADNEWQATVTAPGNKKAVVLTEKKVSHTRAYMAAVTHHREAVMA